MTREIKFRAWEKSTKLMWSDVQNAYDTLGKHGNEGEVLTPCSFGDLLGNDDFVVMQFTGLKDKNGKDVYEGDVVRSYHEQGVVEFALASFGVFFDGRELTPLQSIWERGDGHKVEVIGNVWEHPQLIEKEV